MSNAGQQTALIIGGTGLLGRGIAREFLGAGKRLALLTRGQTPVPAGLEDCEFLHADREKPGEMEKVLGQRTFDVVVDCAVYERADAEQAVRQFSGRTAHYWFIGTDFVYAPVPDARFPVHEDAPKLETLPYAAGKLAAEGVLQQAHADDAFPVTILRPPHILGDGRPAGCDPSAGVEPRGRTVYPRAK
jgi:nucleoside-diphosphate-sugar epimerase